MVRAMMLHVRVHYKDGIDSTLWYMATNYDAYIYNQLLDSNEIAQILLFNKEINWQNDNLVLAKVYFPGFSPSHESEALLVLNTQTGHISPQFHVVFDVSFSTVLSHSEDEDIPSFWNEFDLNDVLYKILLYSDSTVTLGEKWLTPHELEEREHIRVRNTQSRSTCHPSAPPTYYKMIFFTPVWAHPPFLTNINIWYIIKNLHTDYDTGLYNGQDPRAYAAKKKS